MANKQPTKTWEVPLNGKPVELHLFLRWIKEIRSMWVSHLKLAGPLPAWVQARVLLMELWAATAATASLFHFQWDYQAMSKRLQGVTYFWVVVYNQGSKSMFVENHWTTLLTTTGFLIPLVYWESFIMGSTLNHQWCYQQVLQPYPREWSAKQVVANLKKLFYHQPEY